MLGYRWLRGGGGTRGERAGVAVHADLASPTFHPELENGVGIGPSSCEESLSRREVVIAGDRFCPHREHDHFDARR